VQDSGEIVGMAKQKLPQSVENVEVPEERGTFAPLDWQVPDSIITRHATNIVIQRGENELIISFFEVSPPILIGEPKDIEAKLAEIKSIPAICVSRIVVSNDRMKGFTEAFQVALDAIKTNNGVSD
jgi:hypothetical protein